MEKRKGKCISGISVLVKTARISKMTLGLGAPPLPPQMKMLKVFFDCEGVIHCEFAKLAINNFASRFLNDGTVSTHSYRLKSFISLISFIFGTLNVPLNQGFYLFFPTV